MKIKICGLTRPEDVLSVNEALPDYIGFVFAKSVRQISPECARRLRENLSPSIKAVGVFRGNTVDEVVAIGRSGLVDLIQLHGYSWEDASGIKEKTGCPLICAVRITSPEDIEAAQNCCGDYLLLDHGDGGTGKSFEWRLIGEWEEARDHKRFAMPYFIAGGINPQNVGRAMASGKPFAVDLSSGVETDGLKDKNKIMEITRRVRNE